MIPDESRFSRRSDVRFWRCTKTGVRCLCPAKRKLAQLREFTQVDNSCVRDGGMPQGEFSKLGKSRQLAEDVVVDQSSNEIEAFQVS